MGHTIPDSDLTQRARGVIARTFELSSEDGLGELRMGSLPGWDSLGHMKLVLELEEEFGVSFPTYRLAEILDLDAIVTAVQELLAEQ
jgi:acyl carrier protein